jgi:CRISPR-associated protein Cmr2
MSNTDWKLKIYAFLHDPPHKPLVLGKGHEAIGRQLAEQWAGALEKGLFEKFVRPADRIASGADRDAALGTAGSRKHWVDAKKDLTLVHPMDGTDLAVRRPEDRVTQDVKAGHPMFTTEQIDAICEHVPALFEELAPNIRKLEHRDAFLVLWRLLPELLRRKEPSSEDRTALDAPLGAIWEFLPADTRMPTHPIMVHGSLVSCLAELIRRGRKGALLSFSVGPVQGFINASRRLSDLWAGSYLLSESLWQSMVPLVEMLGPDHVVYPSLRGQALLDRWLVDRWEADSCREVFSQGLLGEVKFSMQQQLSRRLRIPSLPNRFVALVPVDEVEELAARCEEGVRSFWRYRGTEAVEALCEAMKQNDKNSAWDGIDVGEAVEHAVRQVEDLLEVSWAASPWELSSAPMIEQNAKLHAMLRNGEALALEELRYAHPEGFSPNTGTLYGDAYEESQRLLDGVKTARMSFSSREEEGLKCSLCGEREVIGPAKGKFWHQRRIWRDVAVPSGSWFQQGEGLCGVCWTKRYWGVEGAKRILVDDDESEHGKGKPVRHPSTGEVAASRFKRDLLEQVKELKKKPDTSPSKLCNKMAALKGAAQKAIKLAEGGLDRADMHVWSVNAVKERTHGDELLEQFAHIDGQFLLPWPRSRKDGAENGRPLAGLLTAAADLRRYASRELNVSPPRPYLAVVHLDGDKLGTWLSGKHPATPTLVDMFHPKLREFLEERLGEDASLRARRVTPAVHAALSGACSAFSQVAAPMTVEAEGLCGHLIYAGGDDALLMAPADEVLELVRRLRLRFSGYPWPFYRKEDYKTRKEDAAAGNSPLQERARQQPFAHLRGYAGCSRSKTGMPRVGRDELHLVFGKKITASAGICVFHYTWPLSDAIYRATLAEKRAKEDLGRNALGISVVRRSGSVSKTGLKFTDDEREHPSADYLRTMQMLVDGFVENISPRLAKVLDAEISLLRLDALDEAIPEKRALLETKAWKMALALAGRAVSRRENIVQNKAEAALGRNQVQGWLQALARACGEPTSGRAGIERWLALLDTAVFLARQGEQ